MELPSAEALAAADRVAGRDPLAAASALRAAGFAPDLAAAALTQATLRRRAVPKFGPDAGRMFFTRAGLEQATRSVVAGRRAARLAAAGVRSVADLGCGLGADAIAFARAGLRVHAVEADPVTAAFAAANVDALGLSGAVSVTVGRAEEFDVDTVDAVFCDPARRSGGRRIFQPADYLPPWDWVLGVAARVPSTVLKVAPGLDFDLAPPGAEVELVSVDREVVEAALWCGPLASVPRRASVVRSSGVSSLVGSGLEVAPVGPVRKYLYDPDGAVVRAHLVAEFAALIGGSLADPDIAYVYADTAVPSDLARGFLVTAVLPFSVKRLRAHLRSADVGAVEILKRGSAVSVEGLRRDLRLAGSGTASVVLTRVLGAPTALVAQPL